MIEHADAAAADILVSVEGEVHFFDAVALGAGAELGLGAGRGAAEEDEVCFVHDECQEAERGFPSRRFLAARGGAAQFLLRAAASRARRSGCLRGARLPRLRFQRRGLLDDRREHRAGLAALRRPVRDPDVRVVRGEDVLEVAVALDAAWRELGDVEVARPLVAVLDEQPAPRAASGAAVAAAGPHEHPRSLELVAVERELQIALRSAASTSSASGVHVP